MVRSLLSTLLLTLVALGGSLPSSYAAGTSNQSHANADTPRMANPNRFDLVFGRFTNRNVLNPGDSQYYQRSYWGQSLRYTRTVYSGLLADQTGLVDSVAIEGGFGNYGVSESNGLVLTDRQVSVFPVSVTARYQMRAISRIEPYVFAGIMKNFAVSQAPAFDAAAKDLNSVYPSFGVGVAVEVWNGGMARLDIGYADMTLGVGYQF